ncbi:HD domain-containing protein [Candidatus Woesearchaeota archaeon]|nr:HD domain-containing protein [Candidatus Woesearchaeota archaeon]
MTDLKIPTELIENLVEEEFRILRISQEKKDKLMNLYLKIVEDKDSTHVKADMSSNGTEDSDWFKCVYPHNLRVGLMNSRLSRALDRPAELAFTSGLLHDFGKTAIKDKTLYVVDDFNDKQKAEMRYHVENGFNIIHSAFPEEAAVILWHHYFQRNSYPRLSRIKELLGSLSLPKFFISKQLAIKRYMREGLQLALADYYDALVTRNNKKNNGVISSEDSKTFLLEEYPSHGQLIRKLYDKGVFGTDYAKILGIKEKSTTLP